MTGATTGPQTWHHGLVARWWAEFNEPAADELNFYRASIVRFGEPGLDLACGTGRLLIPLLEEGFDLDGIDVSDDMLAFARERAAEEGLEVRLLTQAMHELDPWRKYRTIYICDSFGIGGSQAEDREALRRIHDALLPGGALVFSHDLPHSYADQWVYWLPELRSELPLPWSTNGPRRRAANGDEIELTGRLVDVDSTARLLTMEIRPRLWRDGVMVAQEEHTIRIGQYWQPEVLAMLADAGFGPVDVQAAYSGRPARPDDQTLVFIAQH